MKKVNVNEAREKRVKLLSTPEKPKKVVPDCFTFDGQDRIDFQFSAEREEKTAAWLEKAIRNLKSVLAVLEKEYELADRNASTYAMCSMVLEEVDKQNYERVNGVAPDASEEATDEPKED